MGSGKCGLEWIIKDLEPNFKVYCTDYTIDAINKILKVNKKIDGAMPFDMKKSDYNKLEKESLLLFFRVSTEFDKYIWKEIFKNIYNSHIEHFIFIPTENIKIKDIIKEKLKYYYNILRGKENTFCGWLYSHDEFINLFNGDKEYKFNIVKEIPYNDTSIFLIKKNK